ncbi:cytochrome c oxidase subunit 3 [Bradyrhizobium sp. WD16]|uniref:cytochrome c oxidase subunit 3 n=1 Tax=Bradyrhizobium sp. WD16 TaxID=1521768 RepID=UPI0020A49FFA|nr:cytochrome c oxidase subunit 3 [Bradyrhizobium sp. WD16]UTD26999.1 cytochrome-c oxidase [Bradyrhizobium sp. WD16]
MTIVVVFMAGVALVAGWWLSHQRLMAKPWLEEGALGEFSGGQSPSVPRAKLGLGVFLAVVGSLFALFISAYAMRMELIDWRPLPVPKLLWFNTGVLVLSSLALHLAVQSARRDDDAGTLAAVLAADVAAIVFLIGQLLAWRQLVAAGYVVAANPANSFFYLITATHGLHLLGGLVVLNRTAVRAWTGAAPRELRLSVELCATYWHFLLVVWVILLGLLTGWTTDFLAMCSHLLT